jgi:hypothetical protein
VDDHVGPFVCTPTTDLQPHSFPWEPSAACRRGPPFDVAQVDVSPLNVERAARLSAAKHHGQKAQYSLQRIQD